jgi:hypothetical protein
MMSQEGKVESVDNAPIEEASYDRVLPRQVSSGSTRGTQKVGYGNTEIDGSNNRIVITNPTDGTSVGIGTIPGSITNEFGFFALDENGEVVMKIVGPTRYIYDLDNDKNVMQDGKLPDGTFGWAVAKEDYDVEDAF